MAILNNKERILDLVLTSKGRDMLAEGLLNFSYYAFSDEGIDYSGSLNDSHTLSASLDEVVRRNMGFEADQRNNGANSTIHTDLGSFLYTVPVEEPILPKFVTSLDSQLSASLSSSLSLQRQYSTQKFTALATVVNDIQNPVAVIARGTIDNVSLVDKKTGYVYDQMARQAIARFNSGQSIVGMPLSKDFIAIDGNRALNVNDGTVVDIALFNGFSNGGVVRFPVGAGPQPGQATLNPVPKASRGGAVNFPTPRGPQPGGPNPPPESLSINSIGDDIEIVQGVDSVQIDFTLQTSKGFVPSKDGFLIQIFDSGSNGVLTPMVQSDVVDPISNEKVETGFYTVLTLLRDV